MSETIQETAPSPGPWVLDAPGYHLVAPRIFSAGHGHLIAEVSNAENDQQDRWEADAAHIVKCVNAYPDLVAALREAEWIINARVSMEFGDTLAANPKPGSGLANIRAALSKAGA